MIGSPSHGATLGERVRRPLLLPFLTLLLVTASGPLAADDENETEPTPVVRERLTVTDSRLADRPSSVRDVPAHVTVLERAEIEAADATTVQELLRLEAGVGVFDATGSNLENTLDLRGFTGGGVKVYLDGAPLNDPRNNSLSLELVDPAALERVEIVRGSGAALTGGGSEAGVINLWTRAGDADGGHLDLATGDFATRKAAFSGWGRGSLGEAFAHVSRFETDGHRENADARLDRLSISFGRTVGGGDLRLAVLAADGFFGNPGALTSRELAADRESSPFNALDFADERSTQANLRYARAFDSRLSLAANTFARDRRRDILTTGRSAPVFGGFYLASTADLLGATLQLTRLGAQHDLVGGLDWQQGETDAGGQGTPALTPDAFDRLAPTSINQTQRDTTAFYFQDRWRFGEAVTLTAGARWDEDRVGYRERLPDPSNDDLRTYSELSLRGGLSWAASPRDTVYASYGEAFLPPTVEELFAFPGFGSNPDLEPEDSRSLEIGWRHASSSGLTQLSTFQIDTRDEIVFDPDAPLGPFGANVNTGETRRLGVEMMHRGKPRDGVRWLATATWTDAVFRDGANAGRAVPLVPEIRMGLALDLQLSRFVRLRADALHVGEQVLDNDDANTRQPLGAYTVVDARLVWRLAGGLQSDQGVELTLTARNLLDRDYSTRGIYAFDFSTFTNEIFLTPAPGRQLVGGVEWSF